MLFLGFVILPLALSRYSKIEGKYLIKVLNLVITFLLLNVTSWALKGNLSFFRVNYGDLISTELVQIGIIPPLVNYVNFFFHIALLIAFSSALIGLALRSYKAYSSIGWLVLWLSISDSIVLHSRQFEVLNAKLNYNDALTFGYAFMLKGLLFGGFYLVYRSRGFRMFFEREKATTK